MKRSFSKFISFLLGITGVLSFSNTVLSAQTKSCDPLKWNDSQIQFSRSEDEAALTLRMKEKSFSTELPEYGPGGDCIELKGFEKKQLLFAKVLTGEFGTSALHQRLLLVAYRITPEGLKQIHETVLKHTKKTSKGIQTIADKNYSLKETKTGVEIEVTDNLTKNTSISVIR